MSNELNYPSTQNEEWPVAFPDYMRPQMAARYTGHSESTLAKLRMRHKRNQGPRYVKRGSVIIYRRVDLDAWMESHLVEGEG